MGSEIAEKHKATSAIDDKSKCPMCNCSFFLAQVTEQTAEYRKRGGKTSNIAARQHLLDARTASMSTMVIAGLSLMVAPLFAATAFVRALFSISLPVPLPAVAALPFPALLLCPTFVSPLSASTPAGPFGLPLVPVPFPIVLVPAVVSLSPALLIPGPLPLSASVFMVIPVLPPAPVIPAVPFLLLALAPTVPATAVASLALSVSVRATGASPFPVPSVPPLPVSVPAFPLLPLPVTLSLQLSIKAGPVALSLAMVAPAPGPFGRPTGARCPPGCPGNSDRIILEPFTSKTKPHEHNSKLLRFNI